MTLMQDPAPARPRWPRLVATGAGALYVGFAGAVVALVGVPTWLVTLALPGLRLRWVLLQAIGRFLARVLAIDVTVQGALPAHQGFVLVANHASFLDAFVVFLAARRPVAFVAGGVLAEQRIAGPFLRRLGCEFVRRDPARPGSQTMHLVDVLGRGRSLALFPEGGLGDAPGLRPFRTGAFVAAARAHAPVVPVGIRGTREVVPPGRKVIRPGTVLVGIGETIAPTGEDQAAVFSLRDRARDAVSALSGEVDLEQES